MYARWVEHKKSIYKPGFYVVSEPIFKRHDPYEQGNFFRIVQWQEIQMFVQWASRTNRHGVTLRVPQAMEIVDGVGNRQWVYHEDWIIVPEPLNEEWRFDVPKP